MTIFLPTYLFARAPIIPLDFLEFSNYSHSESKKKIGDLKSADGVIGKIDDDVLKLNADKIKKQKQVESDDVTYVQVNLCQKLLFLHQLTHNMTTDCSLNYNFNT